MTTALYFKAWLRGLGVAGAEAAPWYTEREDWYNLDMVYKDPVGGLADSVCATHMREVVVRVHASLSSGEIPAANREGIEAFLNNHTPPSIPPPDSSQESLHAFLRAHVAPVVDAP